MVKKKTKTQLDFELRTLKVERFSRAFETLCRYGVVGVCAWFMSQSVGALAGKTTLAQIWVAFVGDYQLSWTTGILATGGSIAYGLRQRHLRRKVIEQMSPYVKEHEERLDPKRSSSRLSPRGTTRVEDQP